MYQNRIKQVMGDDCDVTFTIEEFRKHEGAKHDYMGDWVVAHTLAAEFDVCDMGEVCFDLHDENHLQQYLPNVGMFLDMFFKGKKICEETQEDMHALRLICVAYFCSNYDIVGVF